MKRRAPARTEPSDLPVDLARGPDPRIWDPEHGNPRTASAAWRRAGEAWSTARGLGGNWWLKLLPPHVWYVVHALGRYHVSRGGLILPWQDGYNPKDYETVSGISVRQRGEALLRNDTDG